MGSSQEKPTQTQSSELSDLVSGVARIIGTRASDLQVAAGELLHPAGKSANIRGHSTIVPELRASFQSLAQCVLLLENETERFRRITRTSSHKVSSENDTRTSSETL